MPSLIFSTNICYYSLNVVILLLLVNFMSGFKLELMYISLIVSIRLNLIHFHGFKQLVLLPQFIEITYSVSKVPLYPLLFFHNHWITFLISLSQDQILFTHHPQYNRRSKLKKNINFKFLWLTWTKKEIFLNLSATVPC